jgi:hypothetical protein
MTVLQRLGVEHVEARSRDPALPQSSEERSVVHQPTAGGVDQEGGRLHTPQA